MAALRDVEHRWLSYARQVVETPATHLRKCEETGGRDPELDHTVRYPGYLGRDYDPTRGVLCVGLVHRAPTTDRSRDDPSRITDTKGIDAIRRWASQPRTPASDARYLNETRAVWEESLPGWRIWKHHFKPVVESLGRTERSIAWTNLAKCRADLTMGNNTGRLLAQVCQNVFPIRDLLDSLEASVVLVAALVPEGWFTGTAEQPIVFRWNGRNATDSLGRRRQEWLPKLLDDVRDRWSG